MSLVDVELITGFCYWDRLSINWSRGVAFGRGLRPKVCGNHQAFQGSYIICTPKLSRHKFAFITICVLTDLFTSLWVNLRSICACWLEKPAELLEKHHRETVLLRRGCSCRIAALVRNSFYSSQLEKVSTDVATLPCTDRRASASCWKSHINFSLGGEHINGAKVPRGVKGSVWLTLLCLKGTIAKVPTADPASLKHCSTTEF